VKYAAWDKVGNAEATKSQAVQIDTAASVSSIQCNGAACSSSTYSAPVSVSLSASDSGGSGVAAIRYTTDGSDPTNSSTLYTSSFTVSATATVKYRAWDNAGNLEATKSQLIQVATTQADTTPPTSVIRCNGAACSTGWYAGAVSISLSATDNSGGSGVAAIRYTTDGSDPTSSSTLYTGTPFTVSATTTVKYRAWDNAGNAEATKSQLVRVDTTVPTVALTSPTNGATVTRNAKITATASDVGSGVARVEFYVDTQLVGTSTSSPYSVSWNTKKVTTGSHTIKAVAFDAAGNSAPSTVITVTVQ
jgi:hypothetical protein